MKAAAVRMLAIMSARLHERIGPPGWGGLLLLAASTSIGSLAWQAEQRSRVAHAEATRVPPSIDAKAPAPPPARLPSAVDVPVLLTRVQRAAVEHGLGWPRADYRFTAASEDAPASIEILCTLEGAYPNVRRFVTAVLQGMPTLTLREFTLSRANADMAEVEAKLSILVYVASDAVARGEAAR